MSTPRVALTFSVTSNIEGAEDLSLGEYSTQPADTYCAATVSVRLNGLTIPAFERYAFDTLRVIARGTSPGEFYPFTCGCGVPGCAGIHEPAVLEVTDDEVRWRFPMEGFAEGWPEQLPDSCVVAFSRVAYEKALADLLAELETLETSTGKPVVAEAGAVFAGEVPPIGQLPQRVAAHRQWQEEVDARESARRAEFGVLWDLEFEMDLGDGQKLTASAVNLAQTMAYAQSEQSNEDFDEILRTQVIPSLLKPFEEVQALIRALDWKTVVVDCFWPALSWARAAGLNWPPSDDQPSEALAEAMSRWPQGQLSCSNRS